MDGRMAVIALPMGGVVGFLGAVIAWTFLDFSLLSSFGLYFVMSLIFGLLPFLACALRAEDDPMPEALPATAGH